MAVFKPRERLVYFRISEDEFHQFSSVCEQEGARSVSELARNAVQRLIAASNQQREDQDLAPRIETLERLIAEVSAQLQQLATLKTQDSVGTARVVNGSENGSSPALDSAGHDIHEEQSRYGNPA